MSRTLEELLQAVHEQFVAAPLSFGHGTDNAWDEAVALVLGVTGLPDDQASLQTEVTEAQHTTIDQLATKRVADRVPLAYLLGECIYMGQRFIIEPGVVVPRSPIGYLLDDGLDHWVDQPQSILDLCCGSGCLGILAALAHPRAQVVVVDVDPLALDVAQRNVSRFGLEQRVQVMHADVREPITVSNQWDLVLCNPPYVDAIGMSGLPPEFCAEPSRGLAAGADGLEVVDHLLNWVPQQLTNRGVFVCEVGASASAFARKHPNLGVVWLDLPQGGEGVFLLPGSTAG